VDCSGGDVTEVRIPEEAVGCTGQARSASVESRLVWGACRRLPHPGSRSRAHRAAGSPHDTDTLAAGGTRHRPRSVRPGRPPVRPDRLAARRGLSHAYRRPSSYSPPAGGPRATPTCNAWSPLPRGWSQRLPPRGGGATRRHCVAGPDRCSCRARSDQRIPESRPTRVTVQISVTDWTFEERPPLVVQGRVALCQRSRCGRYPQMPSFGWVEGSGQDRKDCRLQQPECGATTDPPARGGAAAGLVRPRSTRCLQDGCESLFTSPLAAPSGGSEVPALLPAERA
jgi:hypothetical protein